MNVCVIGAGPSGLTTIKQLLDERHTVTCFEKSDDIGGIWYRHPHEGNDPKAYDELLLTISAKLMAFSDFMPPGERVFFSRSQYLAYLHAYADIYKLRERVRLSISVTDVLKLPDTRWRVAVVSNGIVSHQLFDAVAICSGPFQTPNRDVTDIDCFTGDVVHSSAYRNEKRFRAKRVLIVGLAESGADILRQICEVASECVLSIRSYSFLLPRIFCGNYATDTFSTRAHHYETFVRAVPFHYSSRAFFGDNRFERLFVLWLLRLYGLGTILARIMRRIGRPSTAPSVSQYSVQNATNPLGETRFPLKVDLATEWNQDNMDAIHEWNRRSHGYVGNWSPKVIFCKNVSFIPYIVNGRLGVNDSGIAFIKGKCVTFVDGQAGEFDSIVLCTGFRHDFAKLGPDVRVRDNNVRNLFKHAFYPEHAGRLALIGFVRPFSGGIPICAEMQARYFALLCSNKVAIPENVANRIERDRFWEERSTALSPSQTEAIPSQAIFLDDLAKEIGCLLPIRRLLLKPSLLVRHWFFPFNQACYRLTGPHDMRAVALKELMSDLPGPLASNPGIATLVLASLLPSFIHPKDMDARSLPGESRPPPASTRISNHFLSERDREVARQSPSTTS